MIVGGPCVFIAGRASFGALTSGQNQNSSTFPADAVDTTFQAIRLRVVTPINSTVAIWKSTKILMSKLIESINRNSQATCLRTNETNRLRSKSKRWPAVFFFESNS